MVQFLHCWSMQPCAGECCSFLGRHFGYYNINSRSMSHLNESSKSCITYTTEYRMFPLSGDVSQLLPFPPVADQLLSYITVLLQLQSEQWRGPQLEAVIATDTLPHTMIGKPFLWGRKSTQRQWFYAHTPTPTHLHLHPHVCTYTCTHTHTHTHTHIHTQLTT